MNWMSSDSTLRYSAADRGGEARAAAKHHAGEVIGPGERKRPLLQGRERVDEKNPAVGVARADLYVRRERGQPDCAAVGGKRGLLALLGKRRRRAVERGAQGELVDRFA